MNFKQILVSFLPIIFVFNLYAQSKHSFEMPGIYLLNSKTNKTTIINEQKKIIYWRNNCLKPVRGKLKVITDSSIFVKGKEIELKNIRKIGIRNSWNTPLIIASVISLPMILPELVFIPLLATSNKNFNLTQKWKISKIKKSPLDSARIARYRKTDAKEDSISRDSSQTINITFNPLNSIFNQHTLEVEYKINQYLAFGVGGGVILSNIWWNRNHELYNGTDDEYPFGYYNGWTLMANIKTLNINKKHWYFKTCFFYKYMYYDHVLFENSFGDPNPYVAWIRSEISHVYGLKFLLGKQIFLSEHIAIEPQFGFSVRAHQRTYTDFWTSYYNWNNQWGKIHHDSYPMPGLQASVLLTVGNFKLKR